MGIELFTLTLCVITALVLTGLGTYVMIKLRELTQQIWEFPSPEELAKEIIKIKVPINELPPDVLNKLKQQQGFKNGENGMPLHGPPLPPGKKLEYVG